MEHWNNTIAKNKHYHCQCAQISIFSLSMENSLNDNK